MSRRAHPLQVSVSDERGRPVRAGGLAAWLERAAPPRARGSAAVALVSTRRIRTLNRTYRRQDTPTDVLSFPADPAPACPGNAPFLGDIVIARAVARRQAREAGHAEAVELRVLALHGLLHLLGYDHQHDRGRMRKVEQRLLRNAGIRDGLIERAHT